MRLQEYDAIIVGAGLAGATVAWQLRFAGRNPVLIEDDRPGSASRAAAGLITPITGMRFVPSWDYPRFMAHARRFYQQVAVQLGQPVLTYPETIRIFTSPEERRRFEERQLPIAIQDQDHPSSLSMPFGYFVMPVAARLAVTAYLDGARRQFDLHRHTFVLERDIEVRGESILFPALNLQAPWLILCQGDRARTESPLTEIPYVPAKGEILTLRIPGWREKRVIHAGVWLVPEGEEIYRLGATYEWKQLDNTPTASARQELIKRLTNILDRPIEVIEQQAAVRPIFKDQKPRIISHREYPRIKALNGLGSKGSLMAPAYAWELVEMISKE